MRLALSWVACDIRTGTVLAELPDFVPTSPLKQTMGRSETGTGQFPLKRKRGKLPPSWEQATRHGYAQIVALDGDVPIWGGFVLRRQRVVDNRGGVVAVDLGMSTMDGYLARRQVYDNAWAATSQTTIASQLVTLYAGASSFRGVPFQIAAAASSTLRDRTYRNDEDKTVYAALQELMGVEGGPEWTVSMQLLPGSPTRIVPVFQVADRIGSSPMPGLGPAAEFSMPGNLLSAQLVEDYGDGAGANDLLMTGTSQQDMRPESDHYTADDDGRPLFEKRYTPSTSITSKDTLNAHAARARAAMKDGQQAITCTAPIAKAPRLGRDWVLGDDIAIMVRGEEFSDFGPDGLDATSRAYGWQLDPRAETISPILGLSA